MPIFFIHGANDDWIDVENSMDMYDVAIKQGSYAAIWLVPGAKHGQAVKVAGQQQYRDHVYSFLIEAGVIKAEEEQANAA